MHGRTAARQHHRMRDADAVAKPGPVTEGAEDRASPRHQSERDMLVQRLRGDVLVRRVPPNTDAQSLAEDAGRGAVYR